MGETVNLRTARKQRRRAEARARGDAAAARTSVTAAETERARADTALERHRLEAHRRGPTLDEPET